MADDAWNTMSPTEQWVRNQRFLDNAISRGSEIQLATPLSQVRAGSIFERDPSVSSVRIMDAVTTGKYTYPNGYA